MESLDALLIPASLSTLVTIIAGLSLTVVFDFYGRKIFRLESVEIRGLYFFMGLLCLSWCFWLICMFQLASVLLFKILLGLIVLQAAIILTKFRKPLSQLLKKESFSFGNFPQKTDTYFWWLSFAILIIYFLLSLAVPTDADSLNYHLALPVNILNTGSLWFNKDFLCFRMAGFGEMINLLGVANGCPQLGAFIQMIAVTWVLYALSTRISAKNRLILLTAVLSIPILLFLIPSQKHQLTGVMCTSLCFFIIMQYKGAFNQKVLNILVPCLFFAAGIKYSFFISISVLLLLLLQKHTTASGKFLPLMYTCTVWAAIILTPLFLFRFIHFGDPLSPFFEFYRDNPDPIVLKPLEILKSSNSIFPFPLNFIFPVSFGTITTVFGFATISLIIVLAFLKKYPFEVLAIFTVILLTYCTGQLAPRFYLEPVIWSIFLIISGVITPRYFNIFNYFIRFQFLILIPFIIFGLYSLGPSLLLDKWRSEVLRSSADGYQQSLWINEVLPDTAKVCLASRSRAFLQRDYFPWEYLFLSSLNEPDEAAKLDFKLRHQYKTEYFIFPANAFNELRKKYAVKIVAGPRKFKTSVRNPFNKTESEWIIYQIEQTK